MRLKRHTFDFTTLLHFIDTLAYSAAVTALICAGTFAFVCLISWLMGVL